MQVPKRLAVDVRDVVPGLLLLLLACNQSPPAEDLGTKQEAASPEATDPPEVPAEPQQGTPLAALQAYRAAILVDDGETAASLVTKGTLRSFEDYRNAALTEKRAVTLKRPLVDGMMVLFLRHLIPTEELASMDARGLLVYAYDHGMVGKGNVIKHQLGAVTIEGDLAFIAVEDDAGNPVPLRFELHKEGDAWKVDLAAVMRQMNPGIGALLRDFDPDPHEAMLKMLGMSTGQQYDRSAWNPPKRANGR